MSSVATDVTAETTDVLQRLIRNSCVNFFVVVLTYRLNGSFSVMPKAVPSAAS